jgi:hypothetical protein
MQGKFLPVKINESLSLNSRHFGGENYNIDILSKELHDGRLAPPQRFVIASKCVRLCEKFHSYFHFEQSYFHLLLAKRTKSKQALEEAIIQDPLNREAIHYLEKPDKEFIGMPYKRDFRNFLDFLEFAIGDTAVNVPYPQGSYWDMYEKYLVSNDIKDLHKTIEIISAAHKTYHMNAAKIYYNRHLCFLEMDNEILAKNDLIKARNLDKNVAISLDT